MLDLPTQELTRCPDLRSVLDYALSKGLELTGAVRGIVQLMDWETGCLAIEAQRGFDDEFLRVCRRTKADSGTACGRALRERRAIFIEDVLLDREFAPYRTFALESGFRAVQATPLISSSGAFVGVLSTHFPTPHSPSDCEMQAMERLAQLTAHAIIRQRVRARGTDGPGRTDAGLAEQISRGFEAVENSRELLRRVNRRLRF